MSLTRDAVLLKSTVRGPNSEVGAKICGLPDFPSPQLLFNCFRRHPEELCSNSLGAGKERDRRTAGIIGVFFFVFSCR